MLIYFALLSILLPHGIIGKTEWGFKMFSKYEPGSMSLIISSPHDGKTNPLKQENGDPWPDRWPGCVGSDGCVWKHNCGKPDNETCTVIAYNDAGAAMVARDIADGIRALTGLRPHFVHNGLNRSKLDVNREINEATFDVLDAKKAYRDYHRFVEKARSAIHGRGLLLDIHGQERHDRIELGYLINGNHLDSGEFTAENTSVRNLGKHWCGNDPSCFKMFIHGHRSLGYFLNQEGLRAVPSPEEPAPNKTRLFSGGYTVRKHGSRSGGRIDAIQMEFPWSLRLKSGWESAKDRVVRAILQFLKLNYCITQNEKP